MSIPNALGAIRWRVISAISRRPFSLPESVPTVSFTFDDFPRSALESGGAILKSHGVRGTYYAAMGLMNTTNQLGEHFSEDDLKQLLADGHELGSHTFSHLSCRVATVAEVESDALKGRQAVEQITGPQNFHPFSYPYGHATLRTKARMGRIASSCRGIVPGINRWPIDLNLLRANSLYSNTFDLDAIAWLMGLNQKSRGWLIFYTHDVCDRPSAYGCTPGELDLVVKLASKTQSRILPIGTAMRQQRG